MVGEKRRSPNFVPFYPCNNSYRFIRAPRKRRKKIPSDDVPCHFVSHVVEWGAASAVKWSARVGGPSRVKRKQK